MVSLKGSRHQNAKINEDDVVEIRRLRREEGATWGELRDKYHIGKSGLRKIVSGVNWAHVPVKSGKTPATEGVVATASQPKKSEKSSDCLLPA